MKNTIKYKGYIGSVEYSEEENNFFGKLLGIKALVMYQGNNADELIEDFHLAVDDYLDYCKEEGIDPEMPYKGSFNVRIGSELHAAAAERAVNDEMTLNQVVCEALKMYLKPKRSVRYATTS